MRVLLNIMMVHGAGVIGVTLERLFSTRFVDPQDVKKALLLRRVGCFRQSRGRRILDAWQPQYVG